MIETSLGVNKEHVKKQKLIKRLETENISAKPWYLRGEVDKEARPQNSLIEKYLYFDHGPLKAPQITQNMTRTMESIIRQRIKDKTWDDVERVKPPVEEKKFRNNAPISSEKSTMGLAELYEQSYVNKANKVDPSKEESHEVLQIKKDLKQVISLLDALTNQNFVPNPTPNSKPHTNQPAMNFEEILPTHASDHAAVAPEEVDPPLNKLPAAQREMTDTDRNRLRRIKKVRQKNHYEKINKHTLGNKKKEGVKKPKSEKVAQDNLKTFYRSGRKERSQKKMS